MNDRSWNRRVRILAGLGLALCVSAAVLGGRMRSRADEIQAFRQTKAQASPTDEDRDRGPASFDGAILAMELPRSEDDVSRIVGPAGSADRATMAAIQHTDFWFIPVYSALLVLLGIIGAHGASRERARLAWLAGLTALATAGLDVFENCAILSVLETGGSVTALRHLALAKWTFLYLAAVSLGLLLMTRPYRRELPRVLLKAAGLLFFYAAITGLGVWIVPQFVSQGLPWLAVAIVVFLGTALVRPEYLTDPAPFPRTEPSTIEVGKPDHLLALAQAALSRIDEPELAALKAEFEKRVSEYCSSPRDQEPQALAREVRWELMADLLAGGGFASTRTGADTRAVLAAIAAAAGEVTPPVRQHVAGALAAFGFSSSALGWDAKPADPRRGVAELEEFLIGCPSLAARLAEQLGVAVPFALVLQAELDEIRIARRRRQGVPAEPQKDAEARLHQELQQVRNGTAGRYAPRLALDLDLMGLAFSGGGIRSATFNLGILQALADLRLLTHVDYLSTVSGGGYIGSWFVSWIKRVGGVGVVQDQLSPRNAPDPHTVGARPIRFLREHSSYLTPQRGLLGADTWTLAGIWLRNALLVQSVLVLFLAAVLLLPITLGVVGAAAQTMPPGRLWLVGAAGVMLFVVACLRVATELARFVKADARRVGELDETWAPGTKAGLGRVQSTIVAPAFGGALLLAVCLWSWMRAGTALPDWAAALAQGPSWPVFGVAAALFVVGLLVVQFRAGYARTVPWYVLAVATLLPSGVAAGLTTELSALYERWEGSGRALWHVVALGPPLFAAILGALLVVHIGMLGREFTDDRREWVSRLTAWLMICSAGWLTLFAFAIYAPWAMGLAAAWIGGKAAAAGGLAAWLSSSAWGAYISQGAKTTGTEEDGQRGFGWRDAVAAIAPYVFVLGLLLLVSGATHLLLATFHGAELSPAFREIEYWDYLAGLEPWTVVLTLLGATLAAALLAWRVDVNEFSMHHFYKNRLVRCFLGASRQGLEAARVAHPFTGFDRDDDLLLATLRTDPELGCHTRRQDATSEEMAGYVGPLPIVCAALNLVKGDDLAWQERKAQAFAFTPIFSGFEHVARAGRPPAGLAGDGFRATCAYAYPEGGVRLGTVMAISGAAASPNMGYHSSAPTAFLMTMFNVRLGWWMGNPRHQVAWQKSSPTLGLTALLRDLTGDTTNHSAFVNLTDGGHFENLGVYELVRRRCRFILACDSEEDAKAGFGGLGGLVRKCRTDFGVEITFRSHDMFAERRKGASRTHFALADLCYPGGEQGVLLYLKSSLTDDESSDVVEYSRRVKAFPHESTADQWFDESQFESYRQLGYHIARTTLDGAVSALGAPPGPECWPRIFESLAAASRTAPPEQASDAQGRRTTGQAGA